ncbi:hypothetical protein MXD63_27765 [Frankia sp. Cpl3]|uniref:hypothetical protein n=1 Tax=Parafrankia colletiae TaxID=573497 RepID=UPI0010423DDD|nr:hypothetical protein [Parafrankia colletiae]MCK9903835.1 hypothetical protein [Frankia sp. Cpl3]
MTRRTGRTAAPRAAILKDNDGQQDGYQDASGWSACWSARVTGPGAHPWARVVGAGVREGRAGWAQA